MVGTMPQCKNGNGSKGCQKLCIGCKTMLKQGH